MTAKALAALVLLLCAAGAALALANAGGDEPRPPAAAGDDAGGPVELALKPAHRSGVSGTARLAAGPDGVTVTLALGKRKRDTLPAHIHTGPCSDEPTMRNPRIWATLSDVVAGRSESTVVVATLPELRSESSSINVHDPARELRPLVCGDIPSG